MSELDEMLNEEESVHSKYAMPTQIGVDNPVLPVYTYQDKKYVQDPILDKFIPLTGVSSDFSYKEYSDEELDNLLYLLRDYYGIEVTVDEREMAKEQAALIKESEEKHK